MTNRIGVLVLVLISLFYSCKRRESNESSKLPYDITKLTNATELKLMSTKLKGIQDSDGIVFLVNDDLKGLTAYQNKKIKWKADVIGTCGKPAIGLPEIRYIKLETDKIAVVFGKHSFAAVQKLDGIVVCLGSD